MGLKTRSMRWSAILEVSDRLRNRNLPRRHRMITNTNRPAYAGHLARLTLFARYWFDIR